MAPMMDTHPSPTEADLATDTTGQVQWRPAKDYFLGGKGPGSDSLKTAIDDVETVAPGFLLSEDLGLARISPSPAGSREALARLLQQNHDKWHMYFRNVAGHNHIPHALLSTFAMGGSPAELQRAYDDGEPIQKEKPLVDSKVVEQIHNPTEFRERMMILDEYSNFLAYFKQEIAAHDRDWRAVITKHCFSRTPLADLMLAQQFEGLYHPIIHTGFGIEFEMPDLVAEGLAQAASHDPMNIDNFLLRAEKLASTRPHMRKSLLDLYHQCNTTEKIRTAARLPDGPWRVRDGVLGRALDEIVDIAAQYQVPSTPEAIEEAMLEMISCAAYACAAAHQPGKERKIDFFIMHSVTSSILFTAMIRQEWISLADKARLLEWKARMDLVWYAASAAPKLSEHNLTRYRPTVSKDMTWEQIYAALNAHHDDGHVAKFVRAIKNGEEVSQSIGDVAGAIEKFPVNDDMWLRVAQLCVDSTIEHQDAEKKWVWGAGFDAMWDRVPDQSTPVDPSPVFDNRYLCLTICGYKKPGMSEVDYRNHMVNVSAPLTKDLMVKYGVRRWTQIQNQTATRQMMTQLFDRQMSNVADFDCFSQVFFESLEDYKRMKQDPWFKEHLVNDHEEFADTKKSMMTIGWVHEYVRDGQIVDGFQ